MPLSAAEFHTAYGNGWVLHDGREMVGTVIPGCGKAVGGAPGGSPAPAAVVRWVECLEAYYEGRASLLPNPGLCLVAGSTPLTRTIYEVVAGIPPGQTMTYGEVAAAAGRPGAARAVGAAMASNPFAPVIPCHRVVGSDGTLRGYAGGVDTKASLLAMEASYG
ncbi:MAG: methylated-DNA--[protein]-cysteine S-methyltransferase [Acidimicrobiia bacterium]